MIGHDAGNLVFVLSAAVDPAVLCAAVAWAVRGEPVPGRLLAALAAAAALLAAKGLVLLRLGPLTISSRVPRRVGAGGLHELDGRWIYVSRGVGAERGQAPRLRLGAVPEVSLITLR